MNGCISTNLEVIAIDSPQLTVCRPIDLVVCTTPSQTCGGEYPCPPPTFCQTMYLGLASVS